MSKMNASILVSTAIANSDNGKVFLRVGHRLSNEPTCMSGDSNPFYKMRATSADLADAKEMLMSKGYSVTSIYGKNGELDKVYAKAM